MVQTQKSPTAILQYLNSPSQHAQNHVPKKYARMFKSQDQYTALTIPTEASWIKARADTEPAAS